MTCARQSDPPAVSATARKRMTLAESYAAALHVRPRPRAATAAELPAPTQSHTRHVYCVTCAMSHLLMYIYCVCHLRYVHHMYSAYHINDMHQRQRMTVEFLCRHPGRSTI